MISPSEENDTNAMEFILVGLSRQAASQLLFFWAMLFIQSLIFKIHVLKDETFTEKSLLTTTDSHSIGSEIGSCFIQVFFVDNYERAKEWSLIEKDAEQDT